ncbi:hypothetical protein [Aquimarina sp. I32.4]|uniref:hypothetical protein n=1 Tax=Aquimarina sp. I32.4 TaxID=2053903 RepID=UPI000CDE649E|nr:hypothetical protein [Aquimarina sp. I32.4]
MIKKEISIGLFIALLSNSIGFIACVFIFSALSNQGLSFTETLKASVANDSLGSLIVLGALPNLIIFFLFLRKNNIYRARGVLLATLIAAIFIAISKFA